MIVVDTSALMAVALDEPAANACSEVMALADEIVVSAGTLAETLIVASRRNVGPAMERLIRGLGCQVVPVTEHDAFKVAEAYSQWGKGVHPAGLNYGDCFAYALARQRACPLLFVGEDFTKTDITLAT
jgi:ribonuclease VapC